MSYSQLTATDESAIRSRIGLMVAAWARGDATGYAEACTDDARYVTASGLRLVGRAAITEAHQSVFDGPMHGTVLVLENEIDLLSLAPGVVSVQAKGAVQFPGQHGETSRGAGVLSLVAVSQGVDWRFASFTNTPIL